MKIKVFLASSITEFESDRMSFAVYLNKLNAIFAEQYGVSITPFICETADHSVNKNGRKQDEYNQEIADSDMVIFLLGNNLGEFTKEEFCFSCNKLKENSRPKIYVYFCNKGNCSDDIADFKKVLETEYQHYYDTFEYIDTVKLSTLFNLRRLAFPSMKVEIKGDYFFVDGKMISQDILSPTNIQAFNNNHEINELKIRYDKSDENNKKIIKRRINEIQNDILSVFLDLSNYTFNGEYNCRVTEAVRLLENGDKAKAIDVLDNAHNRDRRAARKRVRQMETLDDISRIKFEINIRKTDKEYSKIDDLYREAVEYALEDRIGLMVLYDYSSWLASIHRVDEAVKIAVQLNDILINYTQDELKDDNISKIDLANIKILLGDLYRRILQFNKAYSAYREAFSFWEDCIDSFMGVQVWTLAEYIEEVACFIQNVPDSVSDIVDPLNYAKGVRVGQLATDIRRLKRKLQDKNQIDFSTLESNPIYKRGSQSIALFEESLSEKFKSDVISDSITFVLDNPICESYILLLFALCIKQSVLDKTKDYSGYARGLSMTILNIATIQNIMRRYEDAEDGANLAISYLTKFPEINTDMDINHDFLQAYAVLYTSYINRDNMIKAQKCRNNMLKYGEKIYNQYPREFALDYTDMLFHLGIDSLHASNFFASVEIFEKIIGIYESIDADREIDRTQYLIPFLISNLRWIEAYSQYSHITEKFQSDFNIINDHFIKAISLFDAINASDDFDELSKSNCVLEINWCNLLYLPPIGDMNACVDIIEQAFEICMSLSLEDNFCTYYQWTKTLEVVTMFINCCCDIELEKSKWLNNLYSILVLPIDFIINNAKLDPLRLIPSHFRHLTDYAFLNSSDVDFLTNYKTVLFLFYESIIDCEDDVGEVKQQLIEKISNSYSEIIKQANSLENRICILSILEKERDKIKKNSNSTI